MGGFVEKGFERDRREERVSVRNKNLP